MSEKFYTAARTFLTEHSLNKTPRQCHMSVKLSMPVILSLARSFMCVWAMFHLSSARVHAHTGREMSTHKKTWSTHKFSFPKLFLHIFHTRPITRIFFLPRQATGASIQKNFTLRKKFLQCDLLVIYPENENEM